MGNENSYLWDSTSRIVEQWQRHIVPLRDRFDPLNALEIGVAEGRTSQWILRHVANRPDDRWYGIDPWSRPSRRPVPVNAEEIERRARENLEPFSGRATILKGQSSRILRDGSWAALPIHLAYVDGDHNAIPTLDDMVLSWHLLVPGGVMVVDDYGTPKYPGLRAAVRGFLQAASEHVAILWSDYQIGLRKER